MGFLAFVIPDVLFGVAVFRGAASHYLLIASAVGLLFGYLAAQPHNTLPRQRPQPEIR